LVPEGADDTVANAPPPTDTVVNAPTQPLGEGTSRAENEIIEDAKIESLKVDERTLM
jgi:hypothetical protein